MKLKKILEIGNHFGTVVSKFTWVYIHELTKCKTQPGEIWFNFSRGSFTVRHNAKAPHKLFAEDMSSQWNPHLVTQATAEACQAGWNCLWSSVLKVTHVPCYVGRCPLRNISPVRTYSFLTILFLALLQKLLECSICAALNLPEHACSASQKCKWLES